MTQPQDTGAAPTIADARHTIVQGYSNYVITDDGKVFSLFKNRWLKQYLTKNGYARVRLSSKGTERAFLVHRLVAQHFVHRDDDRKIYVNHKDSNRLNNHYSNLEWCTAKENTQHAIKAGRHFFNVNGIEKRTHCYKGHEFTPETIFKMSNGDRRCRTCKRNYEKNRWRRIAELERQQTEAMKGKK
ncbi:HNH endonuclease [Rhodococcus pyridinivorans]|uniref:HNH endonuclease n=1 Tax=Rhodococcus pyridinivorans TaxID=103816 RepID=UPI00280B62FA|nr:HNH endonuclease [Rhodococcus pyridinivorans]WMM74449.1 HNH endonuclease [Rhodococcus pyridinivorans]